MAMPPRFTETVTDAEALAALTENRRILSAREVAEHTAHARYGSQPVHGATASKAMRALDRLAARGTIVKIDRNTEAGHYVEAGPWREGRYGWASLQTAAHARYEQQAHDMVADAKAAADAGMRDRLAAVLPAASGIVVDRRNHFSGEATVHIELWLPPGAFDVLVERLQR